MKTEVLEAPSRNLHAVRYLSPVKPVGKPLFYSILIAYLFSLAVIFGFGFMAFKGISHFAEETKLEIHKNDTITIVMKDGEVVSLFDENDFEGWNSEYNDEIVGILFESVKAGSLGMVDIENETYNIPALILSGVILFLAAVCSIPFTILFLVLIYKGWKSIKPLRLLSSRDSRFVLDPVIAVVLLLVPLVSLVWIFPCLVLYSITGKKYASLIGVRYRGPIMISGILLGLSLIVNSLGGVIFQFSNTLSLLLVVWPWLLLACVLEVIMRMVVACNLRNMIEDFAPFTWPENMITVTKND